MFKKKDSNKDKNSKDPKKRSTILDNHAYNEREYTGDTTINFRISPHVIDDRDPEDVLDEQMLFEKLDDLVRDTKFEKFNNALNTTRSSITNKTITEVFIFVTDHLSNEYDYLELYSVCCDYFNINESKFFTALPNMYQDRLITILTERTDYDKKYKLKRLF